MKTPLAIWILAFSVTRLSIAAETLEPCGAEPDEYFRTLDSRMDAGMIGRRVASITATGLQEPEWGVRVLEKQGTYAVRVTTLEHPFLYASSQDRVEVPVRVKEFSLSKELAQRIEVAMSREIAKAGPSDQISLPDNPIFRLSTDGTNCGKVTWQSTESIPSKIVRVFMELRCIPDLPHRKQAEVYAKLEILLNEVDDGSG